MKGAPTMSPTPSNTLFTQKTQTTLDEQINFFKIKPEPKNTFTEKIKNKSHAVTHRESIYENYEKQISKLNKKIIREPVFKDVKKVAETADFANHLMSHLKKYISPYEELILFYFLQTAVSYVVKFCTPEECNLDQLIFLAVILRNDTTIEMCENSLFDLIIKNDLEKNDGPGLLQINIFYERFSKNKTENAQESILKNLLKIAKNYTPYTPKN